MRQNGTIKTAAKTGIGISNPGAPRIGGKGISSPPNLTLKKIRINLGVSRNTLASNCKPKVSGKTIWRAEEKGTIPHEWIQLAVTDTLNRLRLLRDPEAEQLEPTDVFPTERVGV